VTWPVVFWDRVRTISSIALRQADMEALSTFGIEPLELMEVAGWQIARFVDVMTDGVRGKRVIVVAGSGNNGGDALVAARLLLQRGAIVSVSIVPSRDPNSLPGRHALTARRLGIPILEAPQGIGPSADVLIDGLFGTGVHLPLRDPAPAIIEAMNATGRPIVAIDVPSGMDADTGKGAETAVRAAATVTLVAPKAGLAGASNAGRVFVADIGMPVALFGADQQALAALYAVGDLVELVAPELSSAPHLTAS
jgi:ADP-dependent NAD(P)H-hydrate dehydratase / NAD(P)H-hydrate epimerase